MAARNEMIETKVWLDRREHADDDSILEGDWRDPDLIQRLNHLTLYANDLDYQESHSKSAPDWSMGVQARDDNNRVVMEFKGEPPDIIKQAVLNGRILEGVIVARDYQRHGR